MKEREGECKKDHGENNSLYVCVCVYAYTFLYTHMHVCAQLVHS